MVVAKFRLLRPLNAVRGGEPPPLGVARRHTVKRPTLEGQEWQFGEKAMSVG